MCVDKTLVIDKHTCLKRHAIMTTISSHCDCKLEVVNHKAGRFSRVKFKFALRNNTRVEMHHENFSNVAWVIKKMHALSSYFSHTSYLSETSQTSGKRHRLNDRARGNGIVHWTCIKIVIYEFSSERYFDYEFFLFFSFLFHFHERRCWGCCCWVDGT